MIIQDWTVEDARAILEVIKMKIEEWDEERAWDEEFEYLEREAAAIPVFIENKGSLKAYLDAGGKNVKNVLPTVKRSSLERGYVIEAYVEEGGTLEEYLRAGGTLEEYLRAGGTMLGSTAPDAEPSGAGLAPIIWKWGTSDLAWLWQALTGRHAINCTATDFFKHFQNMEYKEILPDLGSTNKSTEPKRKDMKIIRAEIISHKPEDTRT